MAMAKSRRRQNYKQVKSDTKDLGSAGAVTKLGELTPISARNQLGRAYCKNIMMTYILQGDAAADEDQGGVCFYITSGETFTNDDVITARARSFGGGSMSIPVHAWVSGEIEDDAPGGKLFLWAEATDVTLTTNVSIRYTAEVWGSALLSYNLA